MTPLRSPKFRPDAWWRTGILAVSLAIVVKHFAPTIADPDLWGHVLFGQLAAGVGWIPRFDPYSYLTTGTDWINHEWLAERVFAELFDHAGTAGLIGLKLGAALSMVGLILWHLRDRGLQLLRAAVLVLLLSIPMLLGLRTVRPHLFTYLLFTVLLILLFHAEQTRGKTLLLLPPLFAVWVNLHGGVLAGLGVVGIWVGVRTLRSLVARHRGNPLPEPPAAWIWIGAAAASAAATLVNPYGFELLEFLVRTATVPRPFITEWQPLPVRSSYGIVWLAGTGLAAWALLRAERRPGPEAITVLIVLLLLPLTAVRHLALTFLGIPVLAADAFVSLWGGEGAREGGEEQSRTQRRSARAGWIGAGLVIIAGIVLLRTADDLDCIEIDPDLRVVYPARATAWLQASGVGGHLVTFFNYGEYLIWHLAPRMQVSMDGRRETVYPDSIYHAYMDFQHGRRDWDRYLSYGNPEVVIVPAGIPPDNLLELAPGWATVYEDSLVGIHARRGSETAATLGRTRVPDLTADGRGLCFP